MKEIDDKLEKASHHLHHRPPLGQGGRPEEEGGRPPLVDHLPQEAIQPSVRPEEEGVIEVGGDEGGESGKEVVLAARNEYAQDVKVKELLLGAQR